MMVLARLIPCALILVLCCAARAAQEQPLVGAIRWDAWHVGGEGSPVKAMERSLGPRQYHYRLPFFGEVVSENGVRIAGYTQATVDREIAFAKAGGIDYWAFLLYRPDSPMSQALSLYLSSARRQEVRFCAIATPHEFGETEVLPERVKRLLDLMAQPTYQRVAGNRPLLYVFDVTEATLQSWGGEAGAGRLFDGFRAAVRARGLPEPYLVVMDFDPARAKKVADAIHAQAISSYVVPDPINAKGAPYEDLAKAAQRFWEACAATGAQVVPIAVAGWDRRPRVEHPVPWERGWQKPGEGLDKYYQMPTPQELAAHIGDAMRWVVAKRNVCPASAVLVYAWNEHDEGGWLCPTRNPDGTANSDRLDAIAKMRREWASQ